MITGAFNFIVIGVEKVLIIYGCIYVVIQACTLKPYEILNV